MKGTHECCADKPFLSHNLLTYLFFYLIFFCISLYFGFCNFSSFNLLFSLFVALSSLSLTPVELLGICPKVLFTRDCCASVRTLSVCNFNFMA
ncbi:uncharacterized protein V2V93DRAFT_362619 [Kockiozyma suomiensis]|uniref:uncharacterized protein n=1 Tax=Kockiozyma suomiensis TaxID=1337062 RepID=UPI0033442214